MVLKNLNKNCQAKKRFIVLLPVKKLVIMNMSMFIKLGLLWNENDERLSRHVRKMPFFIVNRCFRKIQKH